MGTGRPSNGKRSCSDEPGGAAGAWAGRAAEPAPVSAEEAAADSSGDGRGVGTGSDALSLPWERSAAARVIRRAPHPGHSMMLSGSKDWVIGGLAARAVHGVQNQDREYNVGGTTPMKRSATSDLAAELLRRGARSPTHAC